MRRRGRASPTNASIVAAPAAAIDNAARRLSFRLRSERTAGRRTPAGDSGLGAAKNE
jgi:hypothetical protein